MDTINSIDIVLKSAVDAGFLTFGIEQILATFIWYGNVLQSIHLFIINAIGKAIYSANNFMKDTGILSFTVEQSLLRLF